MDKERLEQYYASIRKDIVEMNRKEERLELKLRTKLSFSEAVRIRSKIFNLQRKREWRLRELTDHEISD